MLARLTVLASALIALSGCGSTSGSSSSQPSPQQSDNVQRDVGYLRALNQITLPFSKPPANLTDYASAERELRKAISQLGTLVAPPPFAPSQAHLVAALRTQAALAPRMARATAAHNSVALNNLEAQVLTAETGVRAATKEVVDEYNGCRTTKFRAC
jgi:hypothetical protein